MRLSIIFLSTFAATTAAMLFSFAAPSGRQVYTGAISCAPATITTPVAQEEKREQSPTAWFVDKNMSDNDLSSHLSEVSTKPVQVAVPEQMPLPEFKD